MANTNIKGRKEILTDNIVRDYFKQFEKDVIIEQQSSDNIVIDKLLKNASKKGLHKGYPDFIIQYKKDGNFLIVIENKKDKNFHESVSHKQYSDYAVDGVLLYASYLSKSYDVVAIAVSGTDKDDLKISHYVQLKGEPKAFKYFSDKLLSPDEYYKGLNTSEEKKRQDYDKLLDYTRDLNTRLHKMNIDEAERCILASCILLALRQKHFKEYYKTEENQSILADTMISDVMSWFKKSNVGNEKIQTIESKYSTIRGMFAKESSHNHLRDLIMDMEENIDDFEKTNRYYDVLGQLYIAFLRYANTSNDLGVVLTPSHITEFFAEVAGVNKNSIVFDNCTGTCGFLIAAMSKMIEDAKGDIQTENSIKSKQLIGIERGDKMYCLAASNMAIHGDGKTNIFLDDGLNPQKIAQIKKMKPSVGMLNPPYKADKKNDVEELEFVKWNLEALVEGGTCVAIVPMQCAISTKGKIANLKKELLQKHTLEAVFSMPDELFYNSDKSVVTCVMVFTAHKPHTEDKETFFGYFKDDGFEKRKNLGRIDAHGKWEEIKDEWCAEAYMQTDYSTLTDEDFIRKMKLCTAFNILNNNLDNDFVYTNKSVSNKKIKLNTDKWQWFKLTDIFNYSKGKRLTKADSIEGDIPLVTAGENNQGVSRYVNNDMDIFSDCITIDMFGYCVYRSYAFCCDDNILVLNPKEALSEYSMIFISTVINKDGYKFAYGRQYRQKTLVKHSIKLPATKSGKPDWQFMEDYIKSLPYSRNL